jgi:hypothetical protein
MDRNTRRLVQKIRELESLFRAYGIDHWADWLAEDSELISTGDLEGISHLLSAYGGMGSMADVYITSKAGHPIDDKDAPKVNSSLAALRSRIFKLATQIIKEHS